MSKTSCPNMNHSKSNPQVVYCPNCGEKFTGQTPQKKTCNQEIHKLRRKDRSLYCHDCGVDLKLS